MPLIDIYRRAELLYEVLSETNNWMTSRQLRDLVQANTLIFMFDYSAYTALEKLQKDGLIEKRNINSKVVEWRCL